MLIIVEDRDIEFLTEPSFDLEASRGADVLQVDAAEGRRQTFYRADDLLAVLGVQTDRKSVDVRKFLEQDGLALHDRHGGLRPDVAQAEHRAAIAHHRDQIALGRIAVHRFFIGVDLAARLRYAWGVSEAEILHVFHSYF